ncbi:MAG TPA: hypothetical protein VL093_00680 [Flavipsychrobacter sp.]|nr:hypothetical protein [Flavipsychrobacter sp.]
MNKRFLSVLLASVLISLTMFSCKKETVSNYGTDQGKGYYPLNIGHFVVYDVDSTIWDDFKQVKTIHKYQMRYTVTDTFHNEDNRFTCSILVHIRNNDTFQWQEHRVIYVTPTPTTIEYLESGVRFIKMVFPVANDVEWKGNSLIAGGDQDFEYLQDWNYQYKDQEQPFNNGKAFFDNTVTVLEADETVNDPETMPDSYASKTFGKEVYGYNIGMVYREITHWTYDGSPGQSRFRRGYSVVMRAVDHN